ncbi:MAG: DUF1269 domain-containing protein [Armatimonadota bacterium]
MEKVLLIVFDTESQARLGEQALRELDAEGSITVFASALVGKDEGGQVTLERVSDQSSSPLLASTLVGALAGLVMGPVGAAVGAAGGAMFGGMYELVKRGSRAELLAVAERQLQPGKAAVIAEVDEPQVLPVETRMAAAGGVVFRLPRTDVEDLLIERELEACRTEIAELRRERHEAEGEARTVLQSRLAAAEQKLADRVRDAQAAIEAAGRVAEAKARTLEERAAAADSERRGRLQVSAADLRADYERRRARLTRALGQVDEAA